MKLADPLSTQSSVAQNSIVFAGSQLIGGQQSQQDCFINFHDECFVVCDGAAITPHGNLAATLAAETAIWGYKHVRQRPFYWADKRLLLKRIFRSSNLTLWQKRRESGFEEGLITTMSVAIVSPNKVWLGSVGDSNLLLYRDSLIDVLTPSDIDKAGRLTNAIGVKHLGLVPHLATEVFLPGDILFMTTSGVTHFVSEEEFRVTAEMVGETSQSISNAVVHLLRIAEEHGSQENMTACIIKRKRVMQEN
jgi:serine/threonine protein phosphatase PrpC